MATSEATVGQEADQYGQFHPVETPELISTKRVEFEEELKKLSPKELASLKQAQEKCPDLLTDEFKLMFLRCEVFNADLAAKRYAHYWDKRIEICGPETAFMPLKLDKALEDDSVALSFGFVQLIPGVSDPSGRALIFINPSNQDRTKYDRLSMARATWYFLHAALESEDAQKHGVVIIGFPHGAKLAQFDRELLKLNFSSMQGAIPMRISAIHICRPPSFFKVIFGILKLFMKERTKKRVQVHFGTEAVVLEKLSQFGLTKNMLPLEIGGLIELNTSAWLERRKQQGL